MALPVSRFSFCCCFSSSSSSSLISASFSGLASPSVLLLTARGAVAASETLPHARREPFVSRWGWDERTRKGYRKVPGEAPCKHRGYLPPRTELRPRSPLSLTLPLTSRGIQIILITFPWVTEWLFLLSSLQNFYLRSGFFVYIHLLNCHISTSEWHVLLCSFTDGKTEVQGGQASVVRSRRQYGFPSQNSTSF